MSRRDPRTRTEKVTTTDGAFWLVRKGTMWSVVLIGDNGEHVYTAMRWLWDRDAAVAHGQHLCREMSPGEVR